MQLNLRKARKLEAEIQQHLDSTRVDETALIRVLGTLDEAKENVKVTRQASLDKLPKREELLRLRYLIRREIEKKNEEIGINELINQKVLVGALSRAEFINHAGPEGLEFEDQFNMNVQSYQVSPGDRYSTRSTQYAVRVFSKADIAACEAKKLEYKREIKKIEDRLGELNIVGKVTLSDDAVKLLQSVGLV
jgi:hypothetical protein